MLREALGFLWAIAVHADRAMTFRTDGSGLPKKPGGAFVVILAIALFMAIAFGVAPVEAGLIKKAVKGAVIVGAVAKYQAKKKAAQRAGAEAVSKRANEQGKTLVIPKEKAAVIKDYRHAAAEGKLIRTDPKSVRGSGFRKRVESEHGPAPGKNYDADHKVELCVGGADCPKGNGQWLERGANRSAGTKIGRQVKDDPVGTRYNRVEVEGE